MALYSLLTRLGRGAAADEPGTGPVPASENLQRLDRRDWHLLLLSFVVIVVLAAGVIVDNFPQILGLDAPERAETHNVTTELLFFLGILFIYVVLKHREIRTLRKRLIQKAVRIESLKFRIEEVGSILEVSSRLTALAELDETLDLVVRGALERLQADQCTLLLKDGDRTVVIAKGSPGEGARFTFRDQGEFGQRMARQVVATCAPLLLPGKDGLEIEEPIVSALAVPMMVEGKTIGALNVNLIEGNDRRAQFTEYDRDLLAIFAHSAGAAIHNSRLYHRILDQNEKLKLSMAYQQRAQQQLVQVERLSAIREMVSGVAHELNNPLTAILGYCQLILAVGKDEELKGYLKVINEETERCRAIVQNFLSFSRKADAEKTSVDVNELIDATIELRRHPITTKGITIEKAFDAALPRIVADRNLLQQAILNLVKNAEEALAAATEGPKKLTLKTAFNGDRIEISVFDTGVGIAPEVLPHVFDPFFTSGDGSRGSGLGLSVAEAILKEHQGTIRVESHPGQGAIFTASLPLLLPDSRTVKGEGDGAASATSALPLPIPISPRPPGAFVPDEPARSRAATAEPEPAAEKHPKLDVLVIDDEESIRTLLEDVVRAEGHRVELATSAAEALVACERKPFDVVFADVQLGELSGIDFLHEAVASRPELRSAMILTTGDPDAADVQETVAKEGVRVLRKPFTIDQVRQLLGDVVRAESR